MKIDAIFAADIHLREDTPVCRTDDFWLAQLRKVRFIKELINKHNCPLFIAGDIFNKARTSPYVEGMAIAEMPKFWGIPGQHDLPGHNMSNFDRSSLNVLMQARIFNLLTTDCKDTTLHQSSIGICGFPFGFNLFKSETKKKFKRKVALIHDMVHKKKAIHENVQSNSGIALLKNNNYDLIVSGDNHQSFVCEYKNKILINCGSMMRIAAGQEDHKPCVWAWDSDTNEVKAIYLPIEKEVISREHIEFQQEKENRMESFVKRVNTNYEIKLSFENNLISYFKKNKTRKGIKEKMYQAMEE